MIIQCEQCQTKFKLDDSKVAEKSIKVRCARCRHVFPVAGPQDVTDDTPAFMQDVAALESEEIASAFVVPEQETAMDDAPEDDSFSFNDAEEQVAPDVTFEEETFSFETNDEPVAADIPPAADDDMDFSFPAVESDANLDLEEKTGEPDDLDFGAFDFGDDGSGDEGAGSAPKADFDGAFDLSERSDMPVKKEAGGLDFSGDDMFGDVVSTSSEEDAPKPISFDMGMDGFADSMGLENRDTRQSTSFTTQDLGSENPFSLDEIDFGDELTSIAVQQISTEELKPSQELLFAPLAPAQPKPVFDLDETFDKTPTAVAQDDLPPLSISSRRKETPRISGMLLLMGIIIAGLVAFYSIWGYMMLTEKKVTIAQDTGRITVRSVEASFVKNKKAGDLLVISGEAVNEYNKPRAAIQIKGAVFGTDGEEVSSKVAFCGNPLSREQLSTMTMDKIEAAMANQFGDSLANMEIAPGDAIPFVIVIAKPPAGAKEYGVEPVGSTVAADKEK